MDKITLTTSQVYLSEENTDPDKYIAKFILCDFGRNKNGVAIDRKYIENWMSTIIDNPLVGKIKMKYDGTVDFTGHNMTVITKTDEEGNEYQEAEFDTDAFGSFKNVSIEEIDGVEYLVASCVIWKRFTTACNLILKRIQTGTLFTSWEITVEKSRKGIVDGFLTKIIEAGRFIGHCLLGNEIEPAFDSSHLLEIASTEYVQDVEFAEALSHDILSELNIKKQNKEDDILKANELDKSSELTVESSTANVIEENTIATAENTAKENNSATASAANVVENNVLESSVTQPEITTLNKESEVASLTEWDLRIKISNACRAKIDKYCWVSFFFPEEHIVWCEYSGAESELHYLKFTYTVSDDEVSVSEPEKVVLTVAPAKINEVVAQYETQISEKDELILKSSEELTALKTEVSELSVFKSQIEEIEKQKAEAEIAEKRESLIASVVKSGMITREEIEQSAEMTQMVNELDKKSLMSIVGERLALSMAEKAEKENKSGVETSAKKETVNVSTNLNNDDEDTTEASMKQKVDSLRKSLRK